MAAGAGYGPAMYRLAVLYEEGRGVKQSYQLAGEWYERADLAAKVKIDEAMKRIRIRLCNGLCRCRMI